MLIINERTTLFLTISFFDEDGDPVTPDSATYRVDYKPTQTAIVPVTNLTGLSTTKDIEITSAQNAMINGNHRIETHKVTVEFTYNTSRHGTNEYEYQIRNLYGVTD